MSWLRIRFRAEARLTPGLRPSCGGTAPLYAPAWRLCPDSFKGNQQHIASLPAAREWNPKPKNCTRIIPALVVGWEPMFGSLSKLAARHSQHWCNATGACSVLAAPMVVRMPQEAAPLAIEVQWSRAVYLSRC